MRAISQTSVHNVCTNMIHKIILRTDNNIIDLNAARD